MALAGTIGGTLTYLHQAKPMAIYADNNSDALNHGDYDGWVNSLTGNTFAVINANTGKEIDSNHKDIHADIEKTNQQIFKNARQVYSKYGFKDHMNNDEIKQAYTKLYQAYFTDKNGTQNYLNDKNAIYKDCAPSGYTVVYTDLDSQNPDQFDIYVEPAGHENDYHDKAIQKSQKVLNGLKDSIHNGEDLQQTTNSEIPKYIFDQGNNTSSNDASNATSSSSNASSSAASSASSASSTATSNTKSATSSANTPVESKLVPTALPSDDNNPDSSNSEANSTDTPDSSNDDNDNGEDTTTDNGNDNNGNDNNGQAPQSATNQQPASNDQSDTQTAASPDNQTLPQTSAKASAGLLLLSIIPLAGSFKILMPNSHQNN